MSRGAIDRGQLKLDEKSLEVGAHIDLTGTWMFKPMGRLQTPPDVPPQSADGFLPVPVPQLLNRIQWWLDDSEDFKKWEDERLKRLGFDTEKNDEGWYRLEFDCPTLPAGRHLFIEFDGVAMKSTAYLNAQKLGDHAGMFSRFSFDLTSHLRPGRNTLDVYVSMEKIPPTTASLGQAVTVNLSAAKVISMSKGMFGPLSVGQSNRAYDLYGIWQPVKFVVRGSAIIDDVHFTPTLDGARVSISPSSLDAEQACILRSRFTDKVTGEQLAEAHHEIKLPAAPVSKPQRNDDELRDVSIGEAGVAGMMHQFQNLKPKLWTPATPNLYRLDVTLETPDGKLLDKWSHNVGFRTFEVKGNQLLLNGHPYWLRGANQLPYGKNPFSPELARKLIQFCHDANIRFTRTHATPWNEAWLAAADEIGLAVSIEGIRPWAFAGKPEKKTDPTLMPPPAMVQHWMMENEDVVKRCRNHPSVFIFTVGNEMLLRDGKNLEKWKILSDVVKQTRALAPNHPIVCSSDYVRDPKLYDETLKPASIDDGDIDDMHRYGGWYADSAFAQDLKFEKELKNNRKQRPLIGQEFATGYPDLDQGHAVWRYTKDLVTPQAWIGRWAYPDRPAAFFLDHHAIVTKRLADALRFEREDKTAGFSLFSLECWFHHTYDPATITPYPTYEAAKEFWAPIGLALDTTRRRFYGGEEVSANLFITNDDDKARSFHDLSIAIGDNFSGRQAVVDLSSAKLAKLDYYQTAKVPIRFKLVETDQRSSARLVVQLFAGNQQISQTSEAIEIFPPVRDAQPASDVPVIQKGQPLSALAPGGELRQKIEGGATAIAFSPGKEIFKLFPDDLIEPKPPKPPTDGSEPAPPRADIGEFADPSPIVGTPLYKDLQPMDIKWWARKDDWRAFISSQSHRLNPGGKARSLLNYIPSHGYIAADKVPEQFRTVLFEIRLGKGRIWFCDLDLDACAAADPAAKIFHRNLYAAARDPHSTDSLPQGSTHKELVEQLDKHYRPTSQPAR